MNMSDQDKETIELMIDNKLNEKLNPIDRKLDRVLDKMDSFSSWQDKTDTAIAEISEQTSIWRWLQRKPKRFAIAVVILWFMSIYEVRSAIAESVKSIAQILNVL